MSRRRRSRLASQVPQTATIRSLTREGRGLTRIDGTAVVVDAALPGERVSVLRTRRCRRHDEAKIRTVLEASPDRVDPRCSYFDMCGGCSLQHMSHGRQLSHKQAMLLDRFDGCGVAPGRLLEPLPGPQWGYRRRARLGVKYVTGKERVLVGFRERYKPYIMDMQNCEVLVPQAARLLAPLAEMVGTLSIRMRLPQIEVAVGEAAMALVLRVLDPPSGEDLQRLRCFAREYDVVLYLQTGGADTVKPLDEPADLYYSLERFDVTIHFEPTDFLQVNAELNERMVDQVVSLLAPGPGDRVLELFCGLGNFTLPLARRAAHVTAVEGEASLVQRAARNARANGIDNVTLHTGDLYDSQADVPWQGESFDLALIDPPRTGATAVLAQVAAARPRLIAYVSCEPESLAIDAAALVTQHGYRLAAAGVMDMFPHTAHVESLALFAAGSTGDV